MRSFVQLSVVAFISITICGCGGNRWESQIKRMISNMNEMCDALESGKRDNILSAIQKMEGLAREFKDNKPDAEEEKRLMEKYKPELEKIQKRMMTAIPKAQAAGVFKMEDMQGIGNAMRNMK